MKLVAKIWKTNSFQFQNYRIRIIGPSILGINYLPNNLCAMFYPVITKSRPLAILSKVAHSQTDFSEWAVEEGLGIYAALNLGNQVDLCESGLLDFLVQEENTRAPPLIIDQSASDRIVSILDDLMSPIEKKV